MQDRDVTIDSEYLNSNSNIPTMDISFDSTGFEINQREV